MAREPLNSIDDYDLFLSETLEPWAPEQRTALAAAMAERWLPAYESFSAAEDWGDPASLRGSLDAVWDHLHGRKLTAADVARRVKQVHDVTPHMDDFDANEALVACVILDDALACCKTTDNLAFALQAALSGFQGVTPDWELDPDAQPRLWKQVAVRKEIKAQLQLVEVIGQTPRFDGKTIKSLRAKLAKSPGKAKTARPKEPSGPTLLTNEVVFEQYRRMVEADLRGCQPIDDTGGPTMFAMLLLGAWLGRYSRRLQTINGGYGALADAAGIRALVARNQCRDAADLTQPDWDPEIGAMIALCLGNPMAVVDARAIDAPHGYGPSLRRLWVEAKHHGLADSDAWQSIIAWSRHRPAAWAVEDQRKKKGLAFATRALGEHLAQAITWSGTGNLDHPWAAEVVGQHWRVRLNDFPDELLYTLIIDDANVGDFHDWPETWSRP